MKPVIASVFAFFLFSSFTHLKPVNRSNGSYQIDEALTLSDMEVGFCNGETIVFPELTMQLEGQGVLNNKVNVLRLTTTFSGTGTSTLTGKVYTFHEVITQHEKLPLVKGAYVQNTRVITQLANNEDYQWKITMLYRLTVNAQGQAPAAFVKMIGSCE